VLLTSVRNEAAVVAQAVRSVRGQTVKPRRGIIVDDGSSDDTASVLRRETSGCEFIQLLFRPPHSGFGYDRKVAALCQALDAAKDVHYEFIGNLDGDLRLPPDYFERLLGEFAANPKLGVAGGVILDPGETRPWRLASPTEVSGGAQMFRRECFERIGGYLPIPEGGEDALACVMARMAGFETRSYESLRIEHLKSRNAAFGGLLKREWQLGLRDHAMGVDPLFELAKCVVRIANKPWILGSLARALAYMFYTIQGRRRVVPNEVVAFMRAEQRRRLKAVALSVVTRYAGGKAVQHAG